MPKYTFSCEECSLEFERTLKMGEHLTHECPSCKQEAFRAWGEDGLSFSFTGSPTGGTANTGVHADDYPTADKAVGRDADARWEEIGAREAVKNQARAQGNTHALIRHNSRDHIDYEPMTQTGRQARKGLANAVFTKMREERASERKNR